MLSWSVTITRSHITPSTTTQQSVDRHNVGILISLGTFLFLLYAEGRLRRLGGVGNPVSRRMVGWYKGGTLGCYVVNVFLSLVALHGRNGRYVCEEGGLIMTSGVD